MQKIIYLITVLIPIFLQPIMSQSLDYNETYYWMLDETSVSYISIVYPNGTPLTYSQKVSQIRSDVQQAIDDYLNAIHLDMDNAWTITEKPAGETSYYFVVKIWDVEGWGQYVANESADELMIDLSPYGQTWCTTHTLWNPDTYAYPYLFRTIKHELGHFFGLYDNDDPSINNVMKQGASIATQIHPDDLALLKSWYDPEFEVNVNNKFSNGNIIGGGEINIDASNYYPTSSGISNDWYFHTYPHTITAIEDQSISGYPQEFVSFETQLYGESSDLIFTLKEGTDGSVNAKFLDVYTLTLSNLVGAQIKVGSTTYNTPRAQPVTQTTSVSVEMLPKYNVSNIDFYFFNGMITVAHKIRDRSRLQGMLHIRQVIEDTRELML